MKTIIIFALLILSSQAKFLTKSKNSSHCHCLILEAGGDLGAYETGAVSALANLLPAEEVAWDLVGGTSIGAVQSAFAIQYPKGQEKQLAKDMINLWTNLDRDSVFKEWFPLGVITGLTKGGLYDTSPQIDTFNQFYNEERHRWLNIGAVDVSSGEMIRFNETLKKDDMIKAVMASAAIPILFPPVTFAGHTMQDGGVASTTDIAGAIARCVAEGFTKDQIIIDAILVSTKDLDKYTSTNENQAAYNLMRSNRIDAYRKNYREIVEMIGYYPEINWRYAIQPSQKLPTSSLPLQFSPEQSQIMIDMGYADAKAAIENGPDFKAESNSFKTIYKQAINEIYNDNHA